MRIAVAGCLHESNTFASSVTGRRHFEEHFLLSGDDLVAKWRDAHHEVGGFLAAGQEEGFQTVPLVFASATPGGPVEHSFVCQIGEEIGRQTKHAQVDGLLLALHGAMVTTEQPSGDSLILGILRDLLGPTFPIVVTFDFHANCTNEMVERSDAAIVYQTNPHIDMREVGRRAGWVIGQVIAGRLRPVQACVKPPLLIPINHQCTASEPLRSLLATAREIESRKGMIRVNVVAGFPYADVPAMGPSVVAVADRDASLARAAAQEVAEQLWAIREAMPMRLPTAAEAVRQAIDSKETPVVLVDFGDNVGGGSPGDGTFLLAELIRQQAAHSVVTIADPQAVRECVAAGAGQSVRLTVGGKTDHRHGEPVTIDGTVRSLHDGRWQETAPRHGGVRFNDQGPTAVVTWGDGNLLCLASRRYPPFSLGQITSLGIDPAAQWILVVKAAIAYRAAYEPVAARIIEVDTPGLTAVNPARFEYRQSRRPLWPLDPRTSWPCPSPGARNPGDRAE